MHNSIEKSKTFIKRHKKAFIIGGSIAAGVLTILVTRKAIRNSQFKNFRLGQLSAFGFDEEARAIAMSEIKIESKGLGKRKLARKLGLPGIGSNNYAVEPTGDDIFNTRTGRSLTSFKQDNIANSVVLVWDDKPVTVVCVDCIIEDLALVKDTSYNLRTALYDPIERTDIHTFELQ